MTPCETAAGLLPDFLQDQLEGPEHASDRLWLRQHLEACADCAAMAAIWRDLGSLPAAAPNPLQRARFDQMLEAYQAGNGLGRRAPARQRGNWFAALAFRPLPAMAAVALLVAGLGAGWLVRGAAMAPPATHLQEPSQEIADLREQVQATRQLAVLSLLQQQSASDRLQGVSYSAGLQGSDPKVADALVHSLKYDASPDVRLAALDALQRSAAQPEIQKSLVEAFHYQKSPLVQIALVDSFVETHDQQARDLLQKVAANAAYSPEVRQRATWGLAQPTWN